MIQIEKGDYRFSVDVEKTKEYYNTHSLCECVCCRNYYKQIANGLPKLKDFLADFGVDISKPDEIMSVENEGFIDYLNVDYTVCGNVINMSEYEIDINDNLFLNVIVTEGFASPNEQTGDYFTLSVTNIKLPWVLEVPIPTPIKIKAINKTKNNAFKSLKEKLFKK
ncbi:MAG: hypothetical protein UGF89_12880 [Acutalibacteraceae bacterium]|nr:hypothetical protein [Acutalibacteraceae bacterium]